MVHVVEMNEDNYYTMVIHTNLSMTITIKRFNIK